MQALQVDDRAVLRRDQPELALGVLQEQVLGVGARYGRLDLLALADAEDGGMLVGHMFDAQAVQQGDQVGAGLHGVRFIAELDAKATRCFRGVTGKRGCPWYWSAIAPQSGRRRSWPAARA